MKTSKSNKVIGIVILFMTLIFVFGNIYRIIIGSDRSRKTLSQTLAVACNLYSLKNGQYPSNLNEIVQQGNIQASSDDLKNISYTLTTDGKDGIITTNLYFGRKYTVNCSTEKFPD